MMEIDEVPFKVYLEDVERIDKSVIVESMLCGSRSDF